MEDKELIELYKQRNELFKYGNVDESNKITEEIEKKLPSKEIKRGFRDSNGNPVHIEIVGQLNVSCFMDNNGWQGSDGKNMLSVDGKTVYKRVLIKMRK